MKKIFAVLGMTALGLFVMSSTCSTDTSELSTAKEVKDSKSSVLPGPGISFEGMDLEKAKKEAKKTGKLIFIDAYTDWCGPCKRMAATSFKDPSVGDLFNENFVNIKIEMEKDADGPEVARLYRVVAYPTLLIIDANGKLVKQTMGMKTSEQLIAFANSAL